MVENKTSEINVNPDRTRFWVMLPFIIAAIVAGILWVILSDESSYTVTSKKNVMPETFSLNNREVSLFFPTEDVSGWTSELRTISGYETKRQEIQRTIEALVNGPSLKGNPAFTKDYMLFDVYIDDTDTLYIDFNLDSSYPNIGGIRAELIAIQSVLKTVRANFPSIKALRFINSHSELTTFAGHIDISKPFLLSVN